MAKQNRPKIFEGGRDMTLSMIFIIALMLVVSVPTGLINFNAGEPEAGPVHEVDEAAFLNLEARAADFPMVAPVVPEEWTPNSARRTQVDGQPAAVVGWVTEDDGYLQLTQTGVGLEEAVRGIDAYPREQVGTTQVAGVEVGQYASEEADVRDLWAADSGSTRYLVSGVATAQDFSELMEAALVAEPIDTSDGN